ncbi:hypothetical protein C8Q78DRAFT_1081603 [Trametes maxima]|nr:hypothetical protein C8Q78DRAFT_1081603 [Trametes maxima]
MLLRTLSPFLPALLLTLCLLVAHSAALSIPPSLKAPARVKSVRSDEQWTNAQRLAAGLPPRAPRKYYKRATSTLANPLGPAPVKRSAPSPSPSPYYARPQVETSYSGRLAARLAGTDTPAGYVRASPSGVSLGGVADSASVAFTTFGPRALFDISHIDVALASDPEAFQRSQETPFIGASGTAALGTGSASAAPLNRVQQTAPHARPAAAGGESTIWTYDAATRSLTAHWVNPDGSHPKTRVAYRARDGALFLAGDVGAYNAAHAGDPVAEVTLYFVSD